MHAMRAQETPVTLRRAVSAGPAPARATRAERRAARILRPDDHAHTHPRYGRSMSPAAGVSDATPTAAP